MDDDDDDDDDAGRFFLVIGERLGERAGAADASSSSSSSSCSPSPLCSISRGAIARELRLKTSLASIPSSNSR